MRNATRQGARGRVSPATIIASLALFFSLAGTGIAASGYRISSLWQIAPKVRRELRGTQGPVGPAGPQGPIGISMGIQGPRGPQGPQGPVGTTHLAVKYEPSSMTTPVAAGQTTLLRAFCTTGEQVIAGGYTQPADSTGITVYQSTPDPLAQSDPLHNDWEVMVRNDTSNTQTVQLTVTAICAS